VDIESRHRDGWTALVAAAQEGYTEVVECLLDMEARNKYGNTASYHFLDRVAERWYSACSI
jgi:ankyrin repeat protein